MSPMKSIDVPHHVNVLEASVLSVIFLRDLFSFNDCVDSVLNFCRDNASGVVPVLVRSDVVEDSLVYVEF